MKRCSSASASVSINSRLPPGRRGLKPSAVSQHSIEIKSPSPRKAWIETTSTTHRVCGSSGRLPPGRRGLKPQRRAGRRGGVGRLPPGRRGLKHQQPARAASGVLSPSPRKAWIETDQSRLIHNDQIGRLPPGRRGLKRLSAVRLRSFVLGRLPPGRRGLKHVMPSYSSLFRGVAFPPEGVD